MPLTKDKKKEVVKRVQAVADSSQSVVFVNFHGLSVIDANELRSGLRQNDVGYFVAKKTLIKRALADKKIEGEQPSLDGEVALAYADDLTAPAREVYNFQKTHPDNVSIIGGVFDGRYMNKEEMEEVAAIPPYPVLVGKFVNIINSPIQRFVIALDKIAETKSA